MNDLVVRGHSQYQKMSRHFLLIGIAISAVSVIFMASGAAFVAVGAAEIGWGTVAMAVIFLAVGMVSINTAKRLRQK